MKVCLSKVGVTDYEVNLKSGTHNPTTPFTVFLEKLDFP